MKKTLPLLALLFTFANLSAQVEKNVYALDTMENLLTIDVEKILHSNLKDKKVVFLGESNHYFGSDLTAKTEFVKYLVTQEGYKDIAFEDDFFSLYFDHNKVHLNSFWSDSKQCEELFNFLKLHNVTFWGFDNQIYSQYTKANFLSKLEEFLTKNGIAADQKLLELTDAFFNKPGEFKKPEGKEYVQVLQASLDKLLNNEKVIQDKEFFQILENYKSFITMLSVKKEQGIALRDQQMSKNLDFLVKNMPDKKFIVWLHNAHMIKDDYGTEPGQTMGYQFVKMNPEASYHIAISSIHMPYRKVKKIEKYSTDKGNLLHFLPSTDKNYFVDAKKIITEHPEYAENKYDGMFVVRDNEPKTNWLKHYDALVFISKGEDVIIKKTKIQ